MDNIDEMKVKADFVEKTLRSTVKELRRLIIDLRPAVLDNLGMVPAIRWLGEQPELSKEVKVQIITAGEEIKLPTEIELIVFRVVQEALNNIRAHASARNAVVTLKFAPEFLKISIQDDGSGFVKPRRLSTLGSKGKFGLIGIQERIQSLNGNFMISSSRKTGTQLLIEIPIHN
jgi:two-component system sensor histidine kinase DegS